MALNTRRVEESVWAPPPGEVTTLVAVTAGTWPAGTRLLVGDPSDTPATATVLGSSVVSADGLTATWALSEADCAILRSRPRFMVQVPSGAAWEGILAGTVNLEPAWSGGRAVQRLGTVMVGPQGPPGAGADAGEQGVKGDPGIGSYLIYTTTDVVLADGFIEGQLAGYRNRSAVTRNIGPESVPAGELVIFEWDGAAWSKVSGSAALPVDPGDLTAPTAPTGIIVTPTSSGYGLTWTASTDNVAVAGYEVSIDGSAWVDSGSDLAHTWTGLAAGSAHYGQVRAYDTNSNRSTATRWPATGTVNALVPSFDEVVASLNPTRSINFADAFTGQMSFTDDQGGTWNATGSGAVVRGPALLQGDEGSWTETPSGGLILDAPLPSSANWTLVGVTGCFTPLGVIYGLALYPDGNGPSVGLDGWDTSLGYVDSTQGSRLAILDSTGKKDVATASNMSFHTNNAINPMTTAMGSSSVTKLMINYNEFGAMSGSGSLARWALFHGKVLSATECESLRVAWAQGRVLP